MAITEPLEFPFTIISVDIGGTKMHGAVVHYYETGPTIESELLVSTHAEEGGEAVLEVLAGLVSDLKREASLEPVAIGIGTAGRVYSQSGSIAFANSLLPGWSGQPVAAYVNERFDVPVAVLNDVQAHALGEARFGAARGKRNCLMIAAGTGLGGAVITQGNLLLGQHGFAGEFGHTFSPEAKGLLCSCGKTSHIECVASGSGIESRYFELTGEDLSGTAISHRADDGEEAARTIIEQAGYALGACIGTWCNIFDTEMVILGGSVCNAGQLWLDALKRGLASQLAECYSDLSVVLATLGANAPIYGAAEYALAKLKGNL